VLCLCSVVSVYPVCMLVCAYNFVCICVYILSVYIYIYIYIYSEVRFDSTVRRILSVITATIRHKIYNVWKCSSWYSWALYGLLFKNGLNY